MVEIRVLTGDSAIEEIEEDWKALSQGSFTETFSHPGWHRAWLESQRVGNFGVVCAYEQGRLLGLLPLSHFRTDARGLHFKVLAPLARGDYQPPIVERERIAEVLPKLLDGARKHFRNAGTLWWPFIPSTDSSLPVLRAYFARCKMPFFEETEVAPRLRISGRSFEEVEKDWTSSHRKDARRQRKRLSEHGPVSLWEPPTLPEARTALLEFFDVHDEKWLAQGYPGMFQSSEIRKLFEGTLQHLWGEGIYFTTVRCGIVNVSYHFGFRAGGWIQWYRPSYRTEYLGYSPGKIHVSLLVEEACRQGLDGMDFLLGDEPYKHLWSNETAHVVSLWAGSSRYAPSYLWFSKGKPYFRKRFAGNLIRAKAWIQKLKRRTQRSAE